MVRMICDKNFMFIRCQMTELLFSWWNACLMLFNIIIMYHMHLLPVNHAPLNACWMSRINHAYLSSLNQNYIYRISPISSPNDDDQVDAQGSGSQNNSSGSWHTLSDQCPSIDRAAHCEETRRYSLRNSMKGAATNYLDSHHLST